MTLELLTNTRTLRKPGCISLAIVTSGLNGVMNGSRLGQHPDTYGWYREYQRHVAKNTHDSATQLITTVAQKRFRNDSLLDL